jgi:hypothetical protein
MSVGEITVGVMTVGVMRRPRMVLLIYYKIPTVLHYRGYHKKSGCKHFITRLHIEKNEPEMFTANKIYGKYRTGNDFFFRI